ncbi:hypothetical protein THAOC_11494, partial [Thalassiosira oceanica]
MHIDNSPEISLRVLLPLLLILERKFGSDQEAGRRVGIIDDSLSYYALRQRSVDDLWVSVKYVLELDRLVFLNLYGLKEPPPRDDSRWQLWRDAGALAVEREGLGSVVYPILKAFGSPGMMYRNMKFATLKSNRVLNACVVDSGNGWVELSFKPNHPDAYVEGHEFCLNRIGCLEAMPLIWGLERAHVEHTICMHDPTNPSAECRYVIRFDERRFHGVTLCFLGLAMCLLLAVHIIPLSPEVSLGIGALVFLSIDGWRRTISLSWAHKRERQQTRDLISMYDKRYMDLWRESEELRRLTLDNRNLASFVPPSLFDQLQLRRDDSPQLGGSERHATIVFVDIRNYSTIAERLNPAETLNVLNVCFSGWVKDVQNHGGTVLEFLGDGMLAVFGAPDDLPSHPTQAVRCLKAMVQTMDKINSSLGLNFATKALPRSLAAGAHVTRTQLELPSNLGFRGGVHTGMVVAGNLGSATQMKYAVVGDTV